MYLCGHLSEVNIFIRVHRRACVHVCLCLWVGELKMPSCSEGHFLQWGCVFLILLPRRRVDFVMKYHH